MNKEFESYIGELSQKQRELEDTDKLQSEELAGQSVRCLSVLCGVR